ncbi:MAG: zinc dependent phospholipase C family protein [Syntrophomonadaceae bacterium]|nr:zinc dependent phospholipase C family protein [Syntrophomonadaceae bacterium]
MFIQTHWLIGKVVTQIALENMPDRIHPLGFCWGSILPDLVSPYKQVPHRLNDSHLLINKLLIQAQTSIFHDRQALSVHLGIIGHFISDYFCQAHNRPDLMDLVPHTIYEAKLLGKITEKSLRDRAVAFQQRETEIPDLYTFLKIKHQLYQQAAVGPKTDINFTMQVVPAIILGILSQRSPREMLHVA